MSIGAWGDENGPRVYRFVKKDEAPGVGPERLMGWLPPQWGEPAQRRLDNSAIAAFQRELGTLDDGIFGWATHKAVVAFQEDPEKMGMRPRRSDGAIGYRTAKELFRPLVDAQEARHEIPADWLCKLLDLEGGWDPSATGRVDPSDRGLAQINAPSHPDVSDEEAFNPVFSIEWAGRRLRAAYEEFKPLEAEDDWARWQVWQLAVAYHNSPVRARAWAEAGYENPPYWLTTADGQELTMLFYVDAIRNRSC